MEGHAPSPVKSMLWAFLIVGVIAGLVAYINNRNDDSASQTTTTLQGLASGSTAGEDRVKYHTLLTEEAAIPAGGQGAFRSTRELKAALHRRSDLARKLNKALAAHEITKQEYDSLAQLNRQHSTGQPKPSESVQSDWQPSGSRGDSSDLSVVIKPLRTDFGAIYGAEARDAASGVLLATAKQVSMEGEILVVEETQYSADGSAIYRGRLFFSAGNELVREQPIEGQKRWQIFRTWISNGF